MATALNFRTLDLNLLRVFDVVMAERNLTRAAERLSLTQPAVSNALKRLKEAVGEDLLTREAFGVKPTPRAEALWPEVRAALGHLRAAFSPESFDPAADPATFRIAMSDATAALFMPPLVARIQADRALANVRVIPPRTRDPTDLLERGEVDLAVGYFPEAAEALASQGHESALRQIRLHDSDYVCVMREGHPLASGELTLDAYCAADHLLVNFSGLPYGRADQALAALGRKRRIMLTVNQYFTAGRVVANSDLVTVLPEFFVGATGYREQVVTRALPFALEGLHVAMLWHRRNDRDRSQQWLRARFLEVAVPPAVRGATP
ncbi:MAG: LysR family transcriptional regulator [Pseudomonadota bacterium]|nr:LysR family transcriptional regulator [Pseudomonadota bacterium]